MPCPFAFAVQVLYGSLSDALVLTSTAPLERVLLIQQSQQSQQEQDTNKSKTSSSLSAVLTDLVTHQGLASLWCGNVLRIANTVLARSLSQVLNEYFVKQVHLRHKNNDDKAQRQQHELIAGFLAGFASIAVVYPFNFALVQMSTMSTPAHKDCETTGSVQACWSNTVQRTGTVTSLFAGLGMTIMGMATHSAVTFGLYNRVMAMVPKTYSNNNDNNKNGDDKQSNKSTQWIHTCLTFGAEQVVHVLAVTSAHPFFTMSVRQQCQVAEKNTTSSTTTLSMLYVGLAASILKAVTGNAVLAIYHSEAFSRFDFVRRFMMKLFH